MKASEQRRLYNMQHMYSVQGKDEKGNVLVWRTSIRGMRRVELLKHNITSEYPQVVEFTVKKEER